MNRRDGTSCKRRLPAALDPVMAGIDDRKPEDILAFCHAIAGSVAFYDSTNSHEGFWDSLLNELAVLSDEALRSALVTSLNSRDDNRPHIALLLVFAYLFRHVQQSLNALTERHLDFFYNRILRILPKPSEPDFAHVVFTSAKNSNGCIVPEGTLLDAGKDADGNPVRFEMIRELSVNSAIIASIKTIHIDRTGGSIIAAPVANSADGCGAAFEDDDRHWCSFGESRLTDDGQYAHGIKTAIGIVVASPLLFMSGGTRTVTIEYRFTDELSDIFSTYTLTDCFSVSVTTAEGLYKTEASVTIEPTDNSLTVAFTLSPGDPPVDRMGEELDQLSFLDTPYVKMELNGDAPSSIYEQIRLVSLSNIIVTVKVKGFSDLVLSNDVSTIDSSKPFFPFGSAPGPGSSLIISSREVFGKPLKELTYHLKWKDFPRGLTEFYSYYSTYGRNLETSSFKVYPELLSEREWKRIGTEQQLFFTHSGDLFNEKDILTQEEKIGPLLSSANIQQTTERYTQQSVSGFARILISKSSQDFGHAEYPSLYAKKMAKRAAQLADNPGLTTGLEELPNPPYTPELASLALNYTTEEQIDFSDNVSQSRIFHITPFGYREITSDSAPSFVPSFPWGTLYLGVQPFTPPGQLSILFQIAEGTEDPDLTLSEKDISWSYLAGDTWKDLSSISIPTDETQGLHTSGVMVFDIGSDCSTDHTELPAGMIWLRASTENDPRGASKIINITAQGATVRRVVSDNVTAFQSTLSAGVIKKMVQRMGPIKSVTQPGDSFGGTPVESDAGYRKRVCERVRHKGRGAAVWDYERLVLEAFPEIYKVKCVSHADRCSDSTPGCVSIAVIPQPMNRKGTLALEPMASAALRSRIHEFLTKRISRFIRLDVCNPRYEQLLVECSVGFYEGIDKGRYTDILNEDLKRFFSPWAYDDAEDIPFGGSIHASEVLTFIERRSYVDHVTDFKLYHCNTGLGIGEMSITLCEDEDDVSLRRASDFIVRPDEEGFRVTDAAEASTGRSILCSAPEHLITPLYPGDYRCASANVGTGIGFMIIELDFIVSEDT